MNIFRQPRLKIAKEKHGLIVDFLDGLRADHRDGRYGVNERPITDEFVLLFCERYGYCKYEFQENMFIRVLTERGAEVLNYMDYDSYLVAKWWEKFYERIPIPISLIAIGISAYVGWFKPETNGFTTAEQLILKQLQTKLKQVEYSLNFLKEHPAQTGIEKQIGVDTSLQTTTPFNYSDTGIKKPTVIKQ